jgi:pimeloyl-ACP methyl ester carboxylesterase
MPNIASKYVQIEDYKIHYLEAGESENTLLLIHGFALSSDVWEKNIPHLSKNFRVIAIDVLGFGKSDVPAPSFKIDEIPNFIFKFMQTLNIHLTNMIGHSMGGVISLLIAIKYPQAIKNLILVGSAGFKVTLPIHFRILSIPIIGKALVNSFGFRYTLKGGAYNKQVISDEFVAKLSEILRNKERKKFFIRLFKSSVSFYGVKFKIILSIQREVKKIKSPVLLIWGRQDPVVYISHALKAQKRFKNAKLKIFENCGHYPQLEHSQEFNIAVEDFLNSYSNK